MSSSVRSGPDSASPSDADLIAQIKQGHVDAFTRLVERHQRSLISFFYHFSWDKEIAEDCAQEVFVKLYRHLDAYEPQAKFTTFLFRVARNLWIDKLRAGLGRHKAVSLEGGGEAEEGRTLRERLPSSAETPVEILAREETQTALRRAIDRLPEEHRIVLILSELQGLKYKEISEILVIPVGTVKSRMHTAVERLKELMSADGM